MTSKMLKSKMEKARKDQPLGHNYEILGQCDLMQTVSNRQY